MKKLIILALFSVLLVGCMDKSIERYQARGSNKTVDYGEFILDLEKSPVVLEETFIVRDDLDVEIERHGQIDGKKNITAPAYFYVFRVRYGKDQLKDVYVPLDIFGKFQPGDTIRWL